MKKIAIGVALYNQSVTGGVSKTLNSIKSDADHTPVVLIIEDRGGVHESTLWNGKADGADGDGVAFAIIGDHDNRPTDMTNLVIQRVYDPSRRHDYPCCGDVCVTLEARIGTGGGNLPIVLESK